MTPEKHIDKQGRTQIEQPDGAVDLAPNQLGKDRAQHTMADKQTNTRRHFNTPLDPLTQPPPSTHPVEEDKTQQNPTYKGDRAFTLTQTGKDTNRTTTKKAWDQLIITDSTNKNYPMYNTDRQRGVY